MDENDVWSHAVAGLIASLRCRSIGPYQPPSRGVTHFEWETEIIAATIDLAFLQWDGINYTRLKDRRTRFGE